MNDKIMPLQILKQADTQELWMELAVRYKVRFGKIEKVFHDGKPSEYTNLELRYREEVASPKLKTI